MKGSVTTSGRDRPNFASTSAIWRTAPPPTCNIRGAAMLAFTAVMAQSSPERASFTTKSREPEVAARWIYVSADVARATD